MKPPGYNGLRTPVIDKAHEVALLQVRTCAHAWLCVAVCVHARVRLDAKAKDGDDRICSDAVDVDEDDGSASGGGSDNAQCPSDQGHKDYPCVHVPHA
eukprot:360740-Chlamydomonas_euryale.AAC.2